MTHIGLKIKERRELLGLTQEELATKLGYKSKSTINKIEMGINDISQSKIKAFADALDTSISYLMGWESESAKQENYYLDDESAEAAQFLFDNPEYKVLFDASRKVKPEDIQFVKEMIERMSNNSDS